MSFGAEPYSFEVKGDLLEYLRRCGSNCDNFFRGPEHFFEIKDLGVIVTGYTRLRVNRTPLADLGCFVNDDFMLESSGRGPEKMDMVGAEKGIYDPREFLKGQTWSIHGLILHREDSSE